MSKKYTSFSELDTDIQIAKLERDIDLELLKHRYYKFKENVSLKNTATPLLSEVRNTAFKYRSSIFKLLAVFVLKSIFKKKKKKKKY